MGTCKKQENHIAVAVRNDAPGRLALQWALEEYGRGAAAQDVLFTLLHVVSDVPNARGKWLRVSEADQQSVAAHVCGHVLPFLEDMQILCDQAEVASSIEVVKNDLRPEAIVKAALKLHVQTLVLGGSTNTTTWGTIAFCTAPGKQPAGCTVISVVNGQKAREVSGTGELALAGSSFSPSSVLGVTESEAEGQSNPGTFSATPNGSAQFGISGMLPLGPSPLNPGSVARREEWRNRNSHKQGRRRNRTRESEADLDEEKTVSLAQGQPIDAKEEEDEEEEEEEEVEDEEEEEEEEKDEEEEAEVKETPSPALPTSGIGAVLDKEPNAAAVRPGPPPMPTIAASTPHSPTIDTPPQDADEKFMLPVGDAVGEEGRHGGHEGHGGLLGAIEGAIVSATATVGSLAAEVLFGEHEEKVEGGDGAAEASEEENSALAASQAAYQAALGSLKKAAEEVPAAAQEDDPEVGRDGLTSLQRARLAYRAGNSVGGTPSSKETGSGDMGGGGKSVSTSRASTAMSGRLAARHDLPMEAARASRSYVATRDRKEQEKITATAVAAIRDSLGQSICVLPTVPRVQSEFRIYTEQEIRESMEEFVPNNVLGEGSYGIVYQGRMEGVMVAIKQLKNPDAMAAMEEIDRELEVQKRCDHQNLVKLLGYSVEDRSLVYEYLSNGSLEDRLLCLNNSPALLWPDRCRIAMETAAALQHLHTRSPPIVHRDVKPANVLLDDTLVAKLGDVGLARVMEDLAQGQSHIVRKSVIVGTEHYVDPEYLCARRGYLGPKSDVYSFGIVLLQVLVGGIPNLHNIDQAVEQELLGQLLDPHGGEWPLMLAMDMANLGLWCSEMDRKDRPDLEEEVIPALLEICEAAALEVVEQEARKQQADQASKVQEEGLALALQEAAKLRAAEEEAQAEATTLLALVGKSEPPYPVPKADPHPLPAPRPTSEAQGGCGCVIQ